MRLDERWRPTEPRVPHVLQQIPRVRGVWTWASSLPPASSRLLPITSLPTLSPPPLLPLAPPQQRCTVQSSELFARCLRQECRQMGVPEEWRDKARSEGRRGGAVGGTGRYSPTVT